MCGSILTSNFALWPSANWWRFKHGNKTPYPEYAGNILHFGSAVKLISHGLENAAQGHTVWKRRVGWWRVCHCCLQNTASVNSSQTVYRKLPISQRGYSFQSTFNGLIFTVGLYSFGWRLYSGGLIFGNCGISTASLTPTLRAKKHSIRSS